MTHHTKKTMTVKVPAAKIWNVLKDFGALEHYAMGIKTSAIVGDKTSGLGAKRLCTFHDGSSLVEEIVDYRDGAGYTMRLSDYSLPLKSMVAEINVKKIDENTSEVTMATEFVVKGGIFGRLLGAFLMKPIMKGAFAKTISGLAYYTATGQPVGKELPSKKALEPILV